MKNKIKNSNLYADEAQKQKRRKVATILIVLFIIVPTTSLLLLIVGFTIYTGTQKIDESLLPTATSTPTFYDVYGKKVDVFEDDYVSPNEVTDALKYAFISTEDKRFESHRGVDFVRIGGAVLHDIKAGKAVEGASTITQQLIKNTHLTHERTLKRKLKEIALALQLEKHYSKDEILSMYLSVIYFGNGLYGVKQAARYYFQKDIKDLTVAECATLAAIVKNPSKYSPNKNAEASKNRRNLVIDKMCEQNYVSFDVANLEKAKPIIVVDNETKSKNSLSKQDVKLYFDSVVQEVCDVLNVTKYQLSNSGYSIYTNYDPNLQKILVNELKTANDEGVHRSILLLDNDGACVLGYASTLGYTPKRQVGSTIKPILYASAIDKGVITLASPMVDEPIDYGGYAPNNFGGVYYGDTTVNEAIKKSMNSIAVKTCDYVSIDDYFDYVKKFGLTIADDDKNYALALGATHNGISPIELSGAYSTFANDGAYSKPSFLKSIQKDGEKLWQNDRKTTQVVKQSTAELIASALEDAVTDGTARTLSALPFKVAAKTGTAERQDGQNSDAWCVSFTRGYTLLDWHGSDEGMQEKGGGNPTKESLDVWKALYNGAENLHTIQKFDETNKSETVEVDVDVFSSIRSKTVVQATQKTPLEYRKRMCFAKDYTLSTYGSYFETIKDFDFDLSVDGRAVNIEFEAEKIYSYDLYRTDVFGTRKILHVDSEPLKLEEFFNVKHAINANVNSDTSEDNAGANSNGTNAVSSAFTQTIAHVDYPFTFFGNATYTLVAYLSGDESIKNASTKSIFADAR